MRRRLLGGICLAAMAVMLAAPAHAQTAGGWMTFPDQIVQQYATAAAGWSATLQRLAFGTFGILAMLHLAWSSFKLAFKGASIEEFLAEIVNAILFIGFGTFVLGNGPQLLNEIIQSFRQAGRAVGGVGLAPSQILTAGLSVLSDMWSQFSLWNPAATGGLVAVGIVVLIALAFICGSMVIALVQASIYVPFAVFVMGFMGSVWSRDMAITMAREAFALGAKLMMLEVLAGFGLASVKAMMGMFKAFSWLNASVILAAVFILALLVKVLPDWIAAKLGGSSIGEGRALTAAAAGAVGGAAGLALGAVGAGAMGVSAGRLASAQVASSEAGKGADDRMGAGARVASVGLRALGHMATAPLSEASRRLSGEYAAQHGVPTWRMASSMSRRAQNLRSATAGRNSGSTGNP